MTLLLTIVNTAILVLLAGDRIKAYLAKSTWDDAVIEVIKKFAEKSDKKDEA
jgi:hypothetical protein